MAAFFSKLKDNWVRVALSALVLFVFLANATGVFHFAFVELMENLAYDTHLLLTMPDTVDDSVVIVDIDEVSLTAEGRWPWPRDKLARLVEVLFETYEIGILGFDIVFAERDESSGLNVLEQLAENELQGNQDFVNRLHVIRPQLDYDGIFAEAIQNYDVILGYYFNLGSELETSQIGALPEPIFEKSVFQGKNVQFLKATGYGGNIQALTTSSLGAGHFTQQPDPDGVVRRALEVDKIIPRFEKPLFDTRGYPGLEWLSIGRVTIPVDRNVKTLVPYRGGAKSFPYVPATHVLHEVADKNTMKGRIVLLGTSAPGLLDLRATPVDEIYPGVEVHANLIAGILNGSVLEFPEYTLGAEVIMLVVTGIGMILAGTLLSPFYAMLFTTVGILLYIGFNHLVWASGGVVLPLASGILMVLTMFLLQMSYGYFYETRGKRQLAGLFGQYIPPELVDEMAKDPTDYSHEAEQRELTVLFSDVRDFTTLSEGVSPKELSELMNQFLTPMTGIIHDCRGTIDKYMGDAIMAFWGAPLPDEEHPRHALEAGIQLLASLAGINQQFRERGWPEIRIGVGINTGIMSVGDMGSEFRMAYTVMGDEVNLGSRLEGLTKGYKAGLIISESTKTAVPEYLYRELDRVRVKGKAKPVAIYEPLCLKDNVDKEMKKELKLYAETIRLYRAQQWDMAELNFVNLQRTSSTPGLYDSYVDRIKHFRIEPPPADWDGVFDHKTK